MLKDLMRIINIFYTTLIICLVPLFTVIGLLTTLALIGPYQHAKDPYERKACLWIMTQWNAFSFLVISFVGGLLFGEDALDWYNHYFPHPGWLVQMPLWIFNIHFQGMDDLASSTLLDWALCTFLFLLTSFWKPFGEVKYIDDKYVYLAPDGYTLVDVLAAYKAQQEQERLWEEKRKKSAQKAAATRARNAAAKKLQQAMQTEMESEK